MSKRSKDTPAGDYEVGYGKPPKSTRFKPGQSGNPKGRTKMQQDDDSVVTRLLTEARDVVENGRKRKMPNIELLFRRHLSKALAGDVRSTKLLLDVMNHERSAKSQSSEDHPYDYTILSDEELTNLDWYLTKMSKRIGK